VVVLADGWGGDPGGSDGAKLARRCCFPVRFLPAAGRLEGAGCAAGRAILRFARWAALSGGDGVLAVLPAFFALLLFREGWKHLAET